MGHEKETVENKEKKSVQNVRENEVKGQKFQKFEEQYGWLLDRLSIITDNLETYQGRDTVITLLHYVALIISDFCLFFSLSCMALSENFVRMYISLSNCRVMLRLFDDWNVIRDTYRYLRTADKVLFLNALNIFFNYLSFLSKCISSSFLREMKEAM